MERKDHEIECGISRHCFRIVKRWLKGWGEIILAKRLRMKYWLVVRRLKKVLGRRKKKVVFLVNESSKWKTQSLCDEMKRRGGYEVLIALSNADIDWRLPKNKRLVRMTENKMFFEKRGFATVVAYDIECEKAIPLSTFRPDIVFYQHPWGFPEEQMPRNVASYALTCYVPYFVPTLGNPGMHLGQPVHKEVFRHFVLNRQWADYYKSLCDKSVYAGEIVGLGHPMLDGLCVVAEDPGPDGLVIYAPHWSIPHPMLKSFLDLSTFLENGKFILEYAKRHPEIHWAFKPHPTLKVTLVHIGVMSEAEVDSYYREWEGIGEACYSGGYVDLFRRSRALITDCDSFLSEYACTQKPIIHLISQVPNKRTYSPLQPLFDTYYKVHDNRELLDMLESVVVRREDVNRKKRLEELTKSGLVGASAAKNIVDHIEALLGVSR